MRSRPWAWFLLGIASAVVGLLPWLIHGMRLPLQNLWASPVTADTSPIVMLPFSQYSLTTIAALLVAGGAIAGFASRALPGDRAVRHRVPLLLGVLLVQAVAVGQTAAVVGGGLQQRTESALYLALLVAGSVFSVLVGALVLLLVSARRKGAVVAGVALLAPLVGSWAVTLVVSPATPSWLLSVPRWLGPIGVGIAVGWARLRTPGRIAGAVLGGLSLWIGPALLTALTSAAGTRAYARDLSTMLGSGLQIFGSALGSLDLVLPPLLVAASVAAVVSLAREGLARRAARPSDDR